MTKLVIAAALLLGSTAALLADDSGRYSPAEAQIAPVVQQSQLSNVRNTRAQINATGHQAVKPFTAEEKAWFASKTPSQLAN